MPDKVIEFFLKAKSIFIFLILCTTVIFLITWKAQAETSHLLESNLFNLQYYINHLVVILQVAFIFFFGIWLQSHAVNLVFSLSGKLCSFVDNIWFKKPFFIIKSIKKYKYELVQLASFLLNIFLSFFFFYFTAFIGYFFLIIIWNMDATNPSFSNTLGNQIVLYAAVLNSMYLTLTPVIYLFGNGNRNYIGKKMDVNHILFGIPTKLPAKERSKSLENFSRISVICCSLIILIFSIMLVYYDYYLYKLQKITIESKNYLIIGQKDNYFITREITKLEGEGKEYQAANTKKYIEIKDGVEVVQTNMTLKNITLEEAKELELK
jgi:hypothetical protein